MQLTEKSRINYLLQPNNVLERPVFIIISNMLVGYNTNVSYKGTVYHVQTEDSGLKNPHIITLLYNKGAILARKKVSYADIAADPDYKEQARELMKEQHKAMIRELIAGKHTQKNNAEAAAVPDPHLPEAASESASVQPLSVPPTEEQPPEPEPEKKQIRKSLDDILLDYIMKEEDK